MFKGKLGHCIVCNALLQLVNEHCEHCKRIDERRCWKHHNEICQSRYDSIRKNRYDLKYRNLGIHNDD